MRRHVVVVWLTAAKLVDIPAKRLLATRHGACARRRRLGDLLARVDSDSGESRASSSERAIPLTSDPAITYRRSSIEQLALDDDPFDVVVSSLAMHYVEDYRGAVRRIARALKAGGRLAFSVEHPMCTALPQQQWIKDAGGNPLYWPVDDYHLEGKRETKWFIDGVVKYHRTVETYVTTLISAGFSLHSLKEPVPIHGPSALSDLDLHRRRSPFLLLAADLKR